MQQIQLERLPNQAFTLVLGNVTYRLRIFDLGNGTTGADVNMDTVDVVLGTRCLHGDFLIPYPSLEMNNGNFMFYDDLAGPIYWENFGLTCRLYYVAPEDYVA